MPEAEGATPKKLVVVFRAAGDAPVLKVQKFKVDESARFSKVVNFLRQQINADESTAVFCYLNCAFTPSLDERLWGACLVCAPPRVLRAPPSPDAPPRPVSPPALRDDYGSDGRLVVHYALQPAWG